MSSITIVLSIVALLAILLCYAFINQAISHKRQKRARLLAGFETRSRSFKFMLSGFPKGFLPKELTLLVQKSLLHVCEQLAKLDPTNNKHNQELARITQQMAATQKQPAPDATNTSIEDPKQTQEIKTCLEELYKFVFHLEGNKEMTRNQADAYRAMIKHLVLQLTIDSYALHGRIAKDKGKAQLALHYFNLGLDLMLKEEHKAHFEGKIAQLKAVICEIEELAGATETGGQTAPSSQDEETNSEWDNYGQDNGEWQKKQIYD